jgi:hypothetical protein
LGSLCFANPRKKLNAVGRKPENVSVVFGISWL